ncbi:hypothetical protein HHK36_031543 [Tetracentron sinense]|uniref:Uncharacterized protein n=1 Tax=Tetracentron sinense TaxID=13715 RepID=A0A834Y8X9_TETSI|nr:hypothetical protein HHK36_031542 [Tetracentron sinense]KAF8376789.1 hypothetical protein HHK36_031543 [Tetracentron sinense]
MADDLKFLASQFWCLHSKQLRHTFRKKAEESLREEEDGLQDALSKVGGSSPSLCTTIYASRFTANVLRALRRNSTRKSRLPERITPMML